MPVRLVSEAGWRMDPPVSVPLAAGARQAATAAAEPPDDPPGTHATWVTRFVKLFTQNIYKWVQAPLSLHVGNLDLERERALQLPVVQSAGWTKR